jgi:hypothetical protein
MCVIPRKRRRRKRRRNIAKEVLVEIVNSDE